MGSTESKDSEVRQALAQNLRQATNEASLQRVVPYLALAYLTALLSTSKLCYERVVTHRSPVLSNGLEALYDLLILVMLFSILEPRKD